MSQTLEFRVTNKTKHVLIVELVSHVDSRRLESGDTATFCPGFENIIWHFNIKEEKEND